MTTKQKTYAANEHETNPDAPPTEARSAPRLKTTEAAQTAESKAEQAREREIADIARRGAPDPLAEFRAAWLRFDKGDDPVAAALDQIGREVVLIQELVEEKAARIGEQWADDLSMNLLDLVFRIKATETFARRGHEGRVERGTAARPQHAAPPVAGDRTLPLHIVAKFTREEADGDGGFADDRRDRERGRKTAAVFSDNMRDALEDLVEAPHHVAEILPPIGEPATAQLEAVLAKTDAAFVLAVRTLHVLEEHIGERHLRIEALEAALKAAGVTP